MILTCKKCGLVLETNCTCFLCKKALVDGWACANCIGIRSKSKKVEQEDIPW